MYPSREMITVKASSAEAHAGASLQRRDVVGKDSKHPHYLEQELYERMRESGELFEWLQTGSLDGLWY